MTRNPNTATTLYVSCKDLFKKTVPLTLRFSATLGAPSTYSPNRATNLNRTPIRVHLCSFVVPRLLACTVIAFAATRTVSAQTLTGTVTNKTLSRPEAGLPVQIVSHGTTDASVLADTTDAQGRFHFDLPEAPNSEIPLLISTRYLDVDYASERVTDLTTPIEIAVYEVTDDLSDVNVVSHHIIIDAATNQASQIYIFRNDGDRTYKTGTGHGHGIEVPLPSDVTEFFGGPQGLHNHGSTLVDSRPMPPGGIQLAYSFALPSDGRFHQHLVFNTQSVDLLVTPPETPIGETSLDDVGPVTLGQRQYHRFGAKDLEKGQHIAFTVGGVTFEDQSGWVTEEKAPWILASLALIAMIAVAFVKFGQHRQPASTSPTGELGPELRRTALLEQIADLDDRLDAGRIEKNEHARRRDALKAEILDLTRNT